ncbi:MAG: hypothetical protein J6U13_10725 [Salinivirgaceae bacterium]|nr:hypothetical protein [Salinivirgaceae bacterium]
MSHNVGALQGQQIKTHYVLRFQRAAVVGATLPNVSFAALTLRWAMDCCAFSAVFIR